MIDLRDALAEIASILEAEKIPWALLGGLAISTYVEPRFTRDIDLAVATHDDTASERLIRSLTGRGYAPTMLLEQSAMGRLATVRMVPPGGSPEGAVVDLLFASSGIEDEVCRDALSMEVFAGLTVPVCRPGHLLALKLLARDDRHRPQDLVDIRALLADLEEVELDRARRGLARISALGFHRGRDLLADLDALLLDQEAGDRT